MYISNASYIPKIYIQAIINKKNHDARKYVVYLGSEKSYYIYNSRIQLPSVCPSIKLLKEQSTKPNAVLPHLLHLLILCWLTQTIHIHIDDT